MDEWLHVEQCPHRPLSYVVPDWWVSGICLMCIHNLNMWNPLFLPRAIILSGVSPISNVIDEIMD